VGEHPRSPSHRPRGQHFLRDARLCAELVRNAGITRGDLIVDIGAGYGALTSELARRAGRVIAIEADPALAAALRSRLPAVLVIADDVLRTPLPTEPFRVVANIPFAHTTAIAHKLLDDPSSSLMRADLVVAWGWAAKRCSQRPSTLLSLSWLPWFELTITRRLHASSFRPVPSTDAAVVTVTRRPDPLLHARERDAYTAYITRAFGEAPGATDADVAEWVARFRAQRPGRRSGRASDRAGTTGTTAARAGDPRSTPNSDGRGRAAPRRSSTSRRRSRRPGPR
jgi:23S rRNA (adenine-N6)-dimethyltransferase